MKKLHFDTGIQEFDINGTGVLRFNPSDPNVYNRFFEAKDRIDKLAEEYTVKAKEAEPVHLDEKGWPVEKQLAFMREIDIKIKDELSYIFGKENDFDAIFSGVNLLAATTSGALVITNFLNAILPVIENGAQKYAEAKKNEALRAAKQNRDQRKELK